MAAPSPYLSLPGNAREALTLYQSTFGGELRLHSYADFGREDGPGDAVAHGELVGPVTLSASDAPVGEPTLDVTGLMLSLLGAAEPGVLTEWFEALAEGGEVLSPLEARTWGDHDGVVRDRFGLSWLIGYRG